MTNAEGRRATAQNPEGPIALNGLLARVRAQREALKHEPLEMMMSADIRLIRGGIGDQVEASGHERIPAHRRPAINIYGYLELGAEETCLGTKSRLESKA
jgi:hypothetical protein